MAHLYAVMMKQIDLPIQVLVDLGNSQTSTKRIVEEFPPTKSFVVLWSAEIRIVLPNEKDDKPSTMFFVGLPIFNNVSF